MKSSAFDNAQRGLVLPTYELTKGATQLFRLVLISIVFTTSVEPALAGSSGGWLGIEWQLPSQEDVEKGRRKTFKVLRCVDGGPACEAGLNRNDELVSVDGEEYRNLAMLSDAVFAKAPGAMVVLGIVRGTEKLSIHVRVVPYENAKAIYERSALAGDANSMNMLGFMYQKGHGVTQDFAEARRWYERASANGNPSAMLNLSAIYSAGLGVKADRQVAQRWLEKAADAGDVQAAAILDEQAAAALKRLDNPGQRSQD